MPRKPKSPVEKLAPVPDAVLDHFAPPGILEAADVEAATRRFKKALLERALGAELQHHLTREAVQAPRDLHHQHAGKRESPAPQDPQDPRPLSERGCGNETDLARPAQRYGPLEPTGPLVEGGHESIRHPLPRTLHPASGVR